MFVRLSYKRVLTKFPRHSATPVGEVVGVREKKGRGDEGAKFTLNSIGKPSSKVIIGYNLT